MQIDLTGAEMEMIDEALREWAQAPIRDGMNSSIFSAIIRGNEKDSPGSIAIENSRIDGEIKDAQAKSRQRESKALMLRAKLIAVRDNIPWSAG